MRLSKVLFLVALINVMEFYSCTNYDCNDSYEPVCGSDGNTYSNSCYAKIKGIQNYAAGECPVKQDAVIVLFTNDCEYLIETQEERLKPLQLDVEFQSDGLAVRVEYRKSNEYFYCNDNHNAYQEIEILYMTKL